MLFWLVYKLHNIHGNCTYQSPNKIHFCNNTMYQLKKTYSVSTFPKGSLPHFPETQERKNKVSTTPKIALRNYLNFITVKISGNEVTLLFKNIYFRPDNHKQCFIWIDLYYQNIQRNIKPLRGLLQ